MYFFKYSRLSIASAQAFLLVYSVSDPLSFVTIKHRFEEIKEQRSDFQVNFEINLHIKYNVQGRQKGVAGGRLPLPVFWDFSPIFLEISPQKC